MIKDTGDFLLDKFAILLTKCYNNTDCTIQTFYKSAHEWDYCNLYSNKLKLQVGFRSSYSTTDYIHANNQVVFTDFEKAFDSVENSVVMKTLKRQGIEEINVKILEDIYKESVATVKLHMVSHETPIQKGVKLDDTISPKLFTEILDYRGWGVISRNEYVKCKWMKYILKK